MVDEEQEIKEAFWAGIALNSVIFMFALALILLIFRRVVISPLSEFRKTVYLIEENSDLSQRINVNSNDEFGRTAKVFNTLLDEFQTILKDV